MNDRPVFLDLEDVLAAAEALLGKRADVRDYGLLESALARPQATVFGDDAYATIHAKAAAFLSSLLRHHALVDGNRRLGLVALRLFYGLNGFAFEATDDEKSELILAVADGRLSEVEKIAARLEQHAKPRRL